jgi:hypothetical protein
MKNLRTHLSVVKRYMIASFAGHNSPIMFVNEKSRTLRQIADNTPAKALESKSINAKVMIIGTRDESGSRNCDRRRREAQPFRSEVDGFLPLSRHRSAVLRGEIKPHSNDVRERKMTLKFHSRTPSLLQDCTSLPAFSV